ncbi:hypothetical protein [Streptomyces sp. S.PB5]|uniref:DUF6891 domain-containing protein n=1 Tax=Streptomyces sp. S.PB5 TaxID=3020844 RepID=UPI0025B0184A|nr:hypothetical protein [Streptomyces sp. S.PB5]MDN3020703.1 hypothetical protein [Streptomyces sp. S.PB5]
MKIDGGSLDIKVETENHETHRRISAERLRELVHRIGGSGDHFLIVQRIPDRPKVFIQVAHEPGGVYEFQHRTGSVPHMWVTEVTDPDLVADVMVRWARQEEGWDTGVVWERDELPTPAPVPAPDPEVAAQAELHVREMLADGYLDIAAIVRETVYLVEDRLTPAQAEQIVERRWLERVEEQRSWTGPTDPDRLEGAFAALERAGIVAREHFTCCRSCGTGDIVNEMEATEGARGFVFFHYQCTRSAAEGHGLTLYYGGLEHSPEATTAVGREVVAALDAAGLSTKWDGDPGKAIDVTPLVWHKRLVG